MVALKAEKLVNSSAERKDAARASWTVCQWADLTDALKV